MKKFMNYELIEIYYKSTNKIKNEIVDLWVNNNALPTIEALSRVNHVVCAIKHVPSDKIIGVSTAKINSLHNTNDLYYFYGMFVDKNHRGGVGSNWRVKTGIINKTFDILKNQNNMYVKGLAAILENQRVSNKFLQRYGFSSLNDDQLEYKILIKNF